MSGEFVFSVVAICNTEIPIKNATGPQTKEAGEKDKLGAPEGFTSVVPIDVIVRCWHRKL